MCRSAAVMIRVFGLSNLAISLLVLVRLSVQETSNVSDTLTQRESYKKLFALQRAEHHAAVKKVMDLDSYEKQYKMVNVLLQKLFSVMQENKVKLMAGGFTPGDPIPQDNDLRDAFSVILENTAIFGDIVLRLPRITHVLYDKNNEWQVLAKWGVGFCNESGIFDDGPNAKLISLEALSKLTNNPNHIVVALDRDWYVRGDIQSNCAALVYEIVFKMAQELELVERDPNFVNPYKADDDLDKLIDDELSKQKAGLEKKLKKKKKREKRKGPRLSKAEL